MEEIESDEGSEGGGWGGWGVSGVRRKERRVAGRECESGKKKKSSDAVMAQRPVFTLLRGRI